MSKEVFQFIRTMALHIFTLPRKIPIKFLHWAVFIFLLLLLVFEVMILIYDGISTAVGFWLAIIILFLISSSKGLSKQPDDKSLINIAKSFSIWLTSDNHKFEHFKAGILRFLQSYKSIDRIIKTVNTILFVLGGLSLLKGCSPEWTGGEGAGGVGGALQSFDFIFYGIFLLIASGWVVLLYKGSMANNKIISIFSAFMSVTTGLLLLYTGLFNYNPFTRSNSNILYLVPGELIGFFSEALFIIIAMNPFVTLVKTLKQNKS